MRNNPMLDENFLLELEKQRNRENYARVTLLDVNEAPVEQIEGKITSGSINVDGTSTIRRSCSLAFVTNNININDFYWGVKSKFILEIGLKNTINTDLYDDIIWFKQGVFVITAFNATLSTNSFTINISGKDKMCLLNGDLAGNIMNISEDFGEKWIWKDDAHKEYTAQRIPIKEIIYKGVQTYAGELPWNIIINDIAECGFELLQYNSSTPMYMFKNCETAIYENMTLNSAMQLYTEDGSQTTVNSSDFVFEQALNLGISSSSDTSLTPNDATKIKFSPASNEYYTVYKVTKANGAIGYRLTDLTYAGDLIASAGDTFTSVLDKIKTMLGNFEYFYDIDGKFVFQKKKNYISGNWTGLSTSQTDSENTAFVENNISNDTFSYNFDDNYFITNFANTPNIANIKNDFAVWGKRTTSSGVETPIHFRCAIDKKPIYYKTYDGSRVYTTLGDSNAVVDWREIIYQMAVDYYTNNSNDDFYVKVRMNNIIPIANTDIATSSLNEELVCLYPEGRTGYEKYYTDIQGFWRQLYNDSKTYLINTDAGDDVILLDDYYIYVKENADSDWVEYIQPQKNAIGTKPVEPNIKYLRKNDKKNESQNYIGYDEDIDYYQLTNTNTTPQEILSNQIYHITTNNGIINKFSYNNADEDYYNTSTYDVNDIRDVKWYKPVAQLNLEVKAEDGYKYCTLSSATKATEIQIGQPYLINSQNIYGFLTQNNGIIIPSIPSSSDHTYYGILSDDNETIERTVSSSIPINTSKDIIVAEYKTDLIYLTDSTDKQLLDADGKILIIEGTTITLTGKKYIIKKDYNYYDQDNFMLTSIDESLNFDYSTATKYVVQAPISTGDIGCYQLKYITNDANYTLFTIARVDITKTTNAFIQNQIISDSNSQYSIEYKLVNNILPNFNPATADDVWYRYNELTDKYDKISVYIYNVDGIRQRVLDDPSSSEAVVLWYSKQCSNENLDSPWNADIQSNPESLNFWFDFLDPLENSLEKYSVPQIGGRPKVVNEDSIKAIYYRDIPNVIFEEQGAENNEFSNQTGYTYVKLNSSQKNLFKMSGQGKSAKDRLEELLNEFTYASESVQITSVPIYRIDVNTRISVKDITSNINGEYIISRLSIPLGYNGTMNITAQKAVKLIY